jgi:anti-sigma B factor antagonist
MEESPQFRAEFEELSDGLGIVVLAGEVDIDTAPQFKQAVKGAIAGGASNLIVDMAAVTFIDSTALGVLVSGVRQVRQRDGALAVVCGEENINRVFELTGLNRIFAICATREAATRALAEQAPS